MKTRNRIPTALATAVLLTQLALPAADSPKTEANVVAEITLDAAQPPPKPFLDVTLDVVFTDPAGAQKTVPAYWAGGNQWKVRYSSPVVGTHPDRTQCNETGDTGLHAVEGRVEVTPYTGDNPFFKHGPPGVGKGGRHFTHADGSVVTHYWYRLADRPALLNADLTDQQREASQARVERLHRSWKKDRDYPTPPTFGQLAEFDPSLVVTPPPGLEVGYVPIVTRQPAKEQTCRIRPEL